MPVAVGRVNHNPPIERIAHNESTVRCGCDPRDVSVFTWSTALAADAPDVHTAGVEDAQLS